MFVGVDGELIVLEDCVPCLVVLVVDLKLALRVLLGGETEELHGVLVEEKTGEGLEASSKLPLYRDV